MKKIYLFASLIGMLAVNFQASADSVIFNYARSSGNQWGYVLGMDFNVNSCVSVTALGTFDSNLTPYTDPVTTAQINTSLQQGISSGDAPIIQVAIFDTASHNQVSPTVSFFYNDPNIGNYYAIAGSIFQNIAPIMLGPGTYTIVAAGYNYALAFGNITYGNAPPNPTFDNLLGALSLTGGSARINGNGFGVPPLAFPTDYSQPESGPDFLAGTFIANTNCAPDGGTTVALLGGSLAIVGWLRRRLA